jgi:hypothetical protein
VKPSLPAFAILCAFPGAGPAQSLEVYSEMQRTGRDGSVVAADRGATPREILSPALARNAYTSFHIVLSLPEGTAYTLYVGENPERAARAEVWREIYEKRGGTWIPDRLEGVPLPYEGKMNQPGQTTQAFWLDLWVERDALIRRIKVEPQVWAGDRWLSYPMEARIVAATAPGRYKPGPSPAPIDAPADETARRILAAWLCGHPEPLGEPGPASLRDFQVRNARQDTGLAALPGKEEIWRMVGAPDHAAWCASPSRPPAEGPEWYLKIRDALYRLP